MAQQQQYYNKKKQQAIVDALEARNVWKLKELALSPGGLLNDTLRRRGWPLLVGAAPLTSPGSSSNRSSAQDGGSTTSLDDDCYCGCWGGGATAADRALMEFDVARGTGWTRQQQQQAHRCSPVTTTGGGRKTRLLHCMQQCIPGGRRYFQGFHHAASVVLSTMEAADKDDDDEKIVPRGEEEAEEDQPIMSGSQLEWQYTTEHNTTMTTTDSRMEEKKQDDDSIYSSSSDESILLRELHDSPPTLISDQAHPESAHRTSSCSKRSVAPPPSIQRHFDLATTSAIESSVEILHRLSLSHFADSMSGDDLLPLQTVLRLTVLPLLAYFDPSLHEMLWNAGFTGADACSYSFCLPWILTWFSSDPFLMEQKQGGAATVKRLFDAFVAAHPLLPVYVTVAVILADGREIFTPELYDDDHDFCRVHASLAALPRLVRNWDDTLDRAILLMQRVPPNSIVPLAERYYGATQVRAWLGCRTPQMLQTPVPALVSSSWRLGVPPWRTTTTSQIFVMTAAGLGEGDAAMRKARRRRRRRRVAAATLLVFVAASVMSRYHVSSRPTNVDSKLKPIQYAEHFSATDGLDTIDGFTVDLAVSDIENKPTAPTATLSPKVIVATFLALYLRNFLFVSSRSVESFEAQLLLRSNDDPQNAPLLEAGTTHLQH